MHPAMYLGDIALENCDSYCYLGTTFASNGSLKMAAQILKSKASRAMMALLKNLYKYKSCGIKILLDLFDKMVLPVALYNSEVWGTNCFPVNKNNNNFFDNSALKSPLENLQTTLLKILLGVGEKTSNWAVRSETGRYPLVLTLMQNMLKFYFHLRSSESPIVQAAIQ